MFNPRSRLQVLIEREVNSLQKYAESGNVNQSIIFHKNALIAELTRIFNALPDGKYVEKLKKVEAALDYYISHHPEVKGMTVIFHFTPDAKDYSNFALLKV